MRLYSSPTSPFAAKVRAVTIEIGLAPRLEVIEVNPWEAPAELLQHNPLGQVPTLITDEGLALYDSPVICEYLDTLHTGPRLIPIGGTLRWKVLRLQALADGIMESALLRRLESLRAEPQRSAERDAGLRAAVERGLGTCEREAVKWKTRVDLGRIATACALAYLDFRFAHEDWRGAHPNLAAWYAEFAMRPCVRDARPGG
jgi:glutathione S-transferase